MVIRPASNEDITAICSLMFQLTGHEVSYQEMTNRLHFINQSPFDFMYVYEENNSVLGILGFRIRENIEEVSRFGEVSVIVVNTETRGQGIGRSLMKYAEELSKKHECLGTWLVSGFGREKEAHKFYQQLGYEVTGYRFVKKH